MRGGESGKEPAYFTMIFSFSYLLITSRPKNDTNLNCKKKFENILMIDFSFSSNFSTKLVFHFAYFTMTVK